MSTQKRRSPASFDPSPKDTINLFSEKYTVQAHPSAPHLPYSSYAGRALVYQLRNSRGEYFAFKVFRKKYREPYLIESAKNLHLVENIEGLRAARRQVILPADPASQTYGNLTYAMLMPWIQGKTWFDMLGQARTNGSPLNETIAIHLCNRFLNVMEKLESNGIAHTDISPGNVVVELNAIDVQLLDLEDIYISGLGIPSRFNKGSNGYRHYQGDNGVSCWCGAGDRYAAAIFAAEILILANPILARNVTDEGFFGNHFRTSLGSSRFKEAQSWLKSIAPDFTRVFERTWLANSLESCPKISELQAPIKQLAINTPRHPIDIHRNDSKTTSSSRPVLKSNQDNASTRVIWEPFTSGDSRTTVAKSPTPPQLSSKAKSIAQWSQETVTTAPPEKTPKQKSTIPLSVKIVLVLAIIIFIIIVILSAK